MSVTLSNLLSVGFFPEHDVLGAEGALETPVSTVVAIAGTGVAARTAPSTLMVLGHTDQQPDRAIRFAAERHAAGLLLTHPPRPLTFATRRLAQRCRLPLVLVRHAWPARLVPAMDRFVRRSHTGDPTVVGTAVSRLRSAGDTCEDLVRTLVDVLGHPVALIGGDGRPVAGSLPDGALRACAAGLLRMHSDGQKVHALELDRLLIQPVPVSAELGAAPSLVAVVPGTTAADVRTTSQVLSLAMWALAANLASTAMLLERQGKQNAALLTWLLAEADQPSGLLCEQVAAAGWRLRGSHIGVHVCANGAEGRRSLPNQLGTSLSEEGIPMRPVPDGRGWSLWTTQDTPTTVPADLSRVVRRALLAVEREVPGSHLWAGIGTTVDGPVGLRTTLQEARQACVLAAEHIGPGPVEYLGGSDALHLLTNQYLGAVHRTLAHQLLQPLVAADSAGQLVHTLSCYLDNESSPTATATTLGVHRNTVLQRLDRIRALLSVEFGDADERLALQLATRLVLADAEPGGTGPHVGRVPTSRHDLVPTTGGPTTVTGHPPATGRRPPRRRSAPVR